MLTEDARLAVLLEERERFLARAALVRQRARADQASSTELALALAVLRVLHSAPRANS